MNTQVHFPAGPRLGSCVADQSWVSPRGLLGWEQFWNDLQPRSSEELLRACRGAPDAKRPTEGLQLQR